MLSIGKSTLILALGLIAGALLLPSAAMADLVRYQISNLSGEYAGTNQIDVPKGDRELFNKVLDGVPLAVTLNKDGKYTPEVFTVKDGSAKSWGLSDGDDPLGCPDASEVDSALVDFHGYAHFVVTNVCKNTFNVRVGIRDPAEGTTTSFPVVIDGVDGGDGADVISLSKDGQAQHTVCVTSGGSLYCGQIPADAGPAPPVNMNRMDWGFAPQGDLDLAHDNDGNLHVVATTTDGGLAYGKFPNGSTQASDSGLLADPADNMKFPAIDVAPDGKVWASGHSQSRGNLIIWRWNNEFGRLTWSEINPGPGDQVGMYNSMAVDPVTGNAYFTYAHSSGRTKIAQVMPCGETTWTWLDAELGQAYSTGTWAYNGQQKHFFLVDSVLFELAMGQ